MPSSSQEGIKVPIAAVMSDEVLQRFTAGNLLEQDRKAISVSILNYLLTDPSLEWLAEQHENVIVEWNVDPLSTMNLRVELEFNENDNTSP